MLGGLRIGGYEILSVNIANQLVQKGSTVAIMSLSSDAKILERVNPGVMVYVVRRSFKFDISMLIRAAIVLWRFRPNIILSCAFFEYLVARCASFIAPGNHKHLLAFHQTQPYETREERWNLIYSSVTKLFNDWYIAIHKSQVAFYADKYGLPRKKFAIIPNGVDTTHYNVYTGFEYMGWRNMSSGAKEDSTSKRNNE